MREVRVQGIQVHTGQTVVKIGKQVYNSRVVSKEMLHAGTKLSGPRGGARVLNSEGVRRGGCVLTLANGRKPVIFDDTTVVVLSGDDMDY